MEQDPAFRTPTVTDLSSLTSGIGLGIDQELRSQQQQQQQQQQQARRFLNAETQLPQEEVVTRLSGEVKTVNTIVSRQ